MICATHPALSRRLVATVRACPPARRTWLTPRATCAARPAQMLPPPGRCCAAATAASAAASAPASWAARKTRRQRGWVAAAPPAAMVGMGWDGDGCHWLRGRRAAMLPATGQALPRAAEGVPLRRASFNTQLPAALDSVAGRLGATGCASRRRRATCRAAARGFLQPRHAAARAPIPPLARLSPASRRHGAPCRPPRSPRGFARPAPPPTHLPKGHVGPLVRLPFGAAQQGVFRAPVLAAEAGAEAAPEECHHTRHVQAEVSRVARG